MNKDVTRLSSTIYRAEGKEIGYGSIKSKAELEESVTTNLVRRKYYERPFAYEFYHQFRKLSSNQDTYLEDFVIQAEVHKSYQNLFEKGTIPDFLIHVPNQNRNLVIIEFKRAINLKELPSDFDKLVRFKKHKWLQYEYAVEVIVGFDDDFRNYRKLIPVSNKQGEDIVVIEFSLDSWDTRRYTLKHDLSIDSALR
jgi:hypothetical protein